MVTSAFVVSTIQHTQNEKKRKLLVKNRLDHPYQSEHVELDYVMIHTVLVRESWQSCASAWLISKSQTRTTTTSIVSGW
jgi:hypothetical protein